MRWTGEPAVDVCSMDADRLHLWKPPSVAILTDADEAASLQQISPTKKKKKSTIYMRSLKQFLIIHTIKRNQISFEADQESSRNK